MNSNQFQKKYQFTSLGVRAQEPSKRGKKGKQLQATQPPDERPSHARRPRARDDGGPNPLHLLRVRAPRGRGGDALRGAPSERRELDGAPLRARPRDRGRRARGLERERRRPCRRRRRRPLACRLLHLELPGGAPLRAASEAAETAALPLRRLDHVPPGGGARARQLLAPAAELAPTGARPPARPPG